MSLGKLFQQLITLPGKSLLLSCADDTQTGGVVNEEDRALLQNELETLEPCSHSNKLRFNTT